METEEEMGGRRPPAQGWTPGAPRSWKRQEGPCPGASAGSSALGHLTSDVWSPGLGEDRCPGLWTLLTAVPGNSRRYLQPARVRVAMSDVGQRQGEGTVID